MEWKVGQTVQVQSRTWAGINKPGGCAKITKIHYFESSGDEDENPSHRGKNIQGLDVKYVVGGGFEKNLDPNLVFQFETLQRTGRKRRGRDFLMERVEDIRKKVKPGGEENEINAAANDGAKKAVVNNKRRIPLPIKKDRKTAENENPQSPTLSSSRPSSPSAQSSPPPQPKRRRKVAKKLAPVKKPAVTATSSNNSRDSKPMEIIYAGQSVDVSPLDKALWLKEKKKESPEVRRGLFETTKNNPPTADQSEIAAAVKAAATAVANAAAPSIGSSAKQLKKKQALQSPLARQRSPAEAASFETPTQQHQHQSLSRHQPLHVASSASKLQMPRPPPKSAVKPGKSVPLKRVFENEMRKAKQFIDDLVRPRDDDLEEAQEEDKDPQQASPPSRFVQFMTIFNRIRLRMDDGTIEEDDFVRQVNTEAVRPYDKNEIDTFLDRLSEQGKVMKSDGNIYII